MFAICIVEQCEATAMHSQEKVRNVRQRGTRYDGNKFYNFKCRTDRFKKSPLVYAIDK